MKTTLSLALFGLVLGASCKSSKDEGTTGSGSNVGSSHAVASGSGSGSGSSAGSSVGSAVTAVGSGAGSGSSAPAALPPEQLGSAFEGCWAAWNQGKLDDFRSCYTVDAVVEVPGLDQVQRGSNAIVDSVKAYRTAFPDQKGELELVLVSGSNIASITLVTGTQTGPLVGPTGTLPPSKKKTGIWLGQGFALDPAGHVAHEWQFFDQATLVGQLHASTKVRAPVDALPMPKQVVFAKHDDKEKANRAVAFQLLEAMTKHDATAVGALIADAVVWSEIPAPKDVDKAGVLANLAALWKGFSDLRFDSMTDWEAGDYAAMIGTLAGTNDGPAPGGFTKTGKKVTVPFFAVFKLDAGKVANAWVFYQGGAMPTQLAKPLPKK